MGAHTMSLAERMGDALVRAWRTFYASIGIDIAVAVGAGLVILINTGDPMTPVFWAAVAGLVVRSVLTALATYWARLKFPPSSV